MYPRLSQLHSHNSIHIFTSHGHFTMSQRHLDVQFVQFDALISSHAIHSLKINMEQNDAGLLQMVVLCKTGDVSRFFSRQFFCPGCIMKASRGYASRLRKQLRAKVDHPRDSVVSLNLNESRDPMGRGQVRLPT